MDLIALPSEMVNKIFRFLDPQDVYNFKIACPAWDLEATRWLGKCQAIETFSLSSVEASVSVQEIGGEVFGYSEHFKILMDSLVSNRMMNKDPIHVRPEFLPSEFEVFRSPLYWRYFKENNEYHHILKSDRSRYIETSLANSRRDHLFSFVTFNRNSKSLVEPIYASIPVAGVMIEQNSNQIDLGDEILDFDSSSFAKIPKAPDPFKYGISIVKELNAFNINQWTAQTKIISTDWESGNSLSIEDIYDPDYPIKSLICFKRTPLSCDPFEFFVQNEDIIASDVVLDESSNLYLKPRKWLERTYPRILSIAFAGKNVKAATLSIESPDSTTRAEQLLVFRQSFDFSVDDGRILGFIFIGDVLFIPKVWSEILILIHKTFPFVNFMYISCRKSRKFSTNKQGLIEGIRIHLVHL